MTKVANVKPYATDLTWSSDATRLAFVVDDDIGVVGTDGSGLQRMRSPSRESDPRWVPAPRLARFEGPRAVPIWILRVSGRTLEAQGVIGGLAAEGTRVAVLTHDTPDHCDHVVIWQPGRKGFRKFGSPTACAQGGWSRPVLAGGLAAWISEGISNYTYTSIETSGRLALASAEYRNNDGEGDYVDNLVGGGGLLAWNEWSQLANDRTIRSPSLKAWYEGRKRLVRSGPDSVPVVAADGTHLLVRGADGSPVVVRVDGRILRRFPQQKDLRGASLNGTGVVTISAGKLVDFDLATGDVKRTWKVPTRAVLADVQSGIAAYAVGRSIGLVDLRSGRRTVLSLRTTGTPLAQLEPAGLFYAYGTTDLSRVRLLPFADIRKRLGT